MGDVINLRQVRKRSSRDKAQAEAEANRARFGQAKADRQVRLHEKERSERAHENHRREDHEDRSPRGDET